ncbi:hypothetical protein L208DRAFT_813621 [Tricholoma matsutake]|nr:hypothetical protein L208DRAFT_813621 [Tricholoma matsutake 945]
MVSTPLTALIVALAALLVSLLQMVQQYASSTATRGKVNRAAIGAWASRNKYGWSFMEWRLRIRYARPELSAGQYVKRMEQRSEKQNNKTISTLSGYDLTWVADVDDGPRRGLGARNTRFIITLPGDEAQESIPLSKLTRPQRAAVAVLEKEMKKSQARVSPCKATWCNLMTDLGMDPLDMDGDEYVDADTIATALDTPTTFIQMSDVILFGFLLDMELGKFSVNERVVDMIGKHSNITTHYQQGVGMLTRYSGLAPRVPNPAALRCSPKELSILLRTAHGMIQIGDSLAPITSWGFNSVNHIFAVAQRSLKGEDWENVDIRGVMHEIEPDSSVRWMGKWNKPTVPVLPFLLSLCSNMAVANAFPHQYLSQWTPRHRTIASQSASRRIINRLGFVEAPANLFETMESSNIDIVVMDDFKTANNWGCEHGGLRGWLTTNFVEFTVRMSKCWSLVGMTDAVPVLSRLKSLLVDGTLDATWGRQLNASQRNEHNEGRRMRANSLLWLQVMMFDTWIARKVETIMTGHAPADVSVPVDAKYASEAALMAGSALRTSGWKATRIAFAKNYLARLAEGVPGSMSDGRFDHEELWSDMHVGSANHWADLDAVLTLRAVAMVARLELMKDSSSLWELTDLDPMIQMA